MQPGGRNKSPLRNAKVDKYCCNEMYVDKAVTGTVLVILFFGHWQEGIDPGETRPRSEKEKVNREGEQER